MKDDLANGIKAGEMVMSFRSTEFIDDAARDNQATNALELKEKGWAFGQIADMEDWYASLKERQLIPAGASLSVTGYSLGAHFGGAGHDRLAGFGGDDWLQGEGGNDQLFGGEDNDTIYGDLAKIGEVRLAGADYLDGEEGDDIDNAAHDNRTTNNGEIKKASFIPKWRSAA